MNAVEYHAPAAGGRGAPPTKGHTMHPIELKARREALGLSQSALAQALGVKQVAVSRWESGARGIGEDVPTELADLEVLCAGIIDGAIQEGHRMAQAGAKPVLFAYENDERMWEDHPNLKPLNAAFHRVALAQVARRLGWPISSAPGQT